MFELEDFAGLLEEHGIPFVLTDYSLTIDGPFVIVTKDDHSDEVEVGQTVWSFYTGYTYTVVALLDQTDVKWKFTRYFSANSVRGIPAVNEYHISRTDGGDGITIARVSSMGPNDCESLSSFYLVGRPVEIGSQDDWTPGSILSVTAHEAAEMFSIQLENYDSEARVTYY